MNKFVKHYKPWYVKYKYKNDKDYFYLYVYFGYKVQINLPCFHLIEHLLTMKINQRLKNVTATDANINGGRMSIKIWYNKNENKKCCIINKIRKMIKRINVSNEEIIHEINVLKDEKNDDRRYIKLRAGSLLYRIHEEKFLNLNFFDCSVLENITKETNKSLSNILNWFCLESFSLFRFSNEEKNEEKEVIPDHKKNIHELIELYNNQILSYRNGKKKKFIIFGKIETDHILFTKSIEANRRSLHHRSIKKNKIYELMDHVLIKHRVSYDDHIQTHYNYDDKPEYIIVNAHYDFDYKEFKKEILHRASKLDSYSQKYIKRLFDVYIEIHY